MAGFGAKKERRSFEITSLIDVVFILLIFFMVIIVPGSGGGESKSKDINLPKMKGDKPEEKLDLLTFRIEMDSRVRTGFDQHGKSFKSPVSPNVIYCLFPHDLVDLKAKGITYGDAYEQARKRNEMFHVLSDTSKTMQLFIGDDGATKAFIEERIKFYVENYVDTRGVLISAVTETPFGIIEFITDKCNDMGIINLEFRTAD